MIQRSLVVVTLAVLGLGTVAAAASAHGEDEETYELAGKLVADAAYPGPGAEGASAFLRVFVTPADGSLCYELEWEALDNPTGLVVRLGWAEGDSPEDVGDQIDVEIGPGDIVDEGDGRGVASGCAEADADPLDFLAHEAGHSHITVITAAHPDGAAGGWLGAESITGGDGHEDGGSVDFDTYASTAELTPEHVAPSGSAADGFGDALIEVTPETSSMCWEIFWDIGEEATAVHVHQGPPGEVGPVVGELELIETTQHFGGELEDGFLIGCYSQSHGFDMWGIADGPNDHYVDIHSETHPDGAVRGQLTFVESFAESFGDEEHNEAAGPSRFVPHVLATVLVGAVTIAAVVIWRRGTGLYAAPPLAGVAMAASSYTLLVLAWLMMLLDQVFASADFDGARDAADAWTLTRSGVAVAVLALVTALIASARSEDHPPLRRIGVVLVVGATLMAVLWMGWNVVQPTYET